MVRSDVGACHRRARGRAGTRGTVAARDGWMLGGPYDDSPAAAGQQPGRTHRTPAGMIIPTIDSGLEALLRTELPLPESVGDVSFESPSGTWSAQLSRITVNLFLFGVGRSAQQPRPAVDRDQNGQRQRRPPIPMLEMHYLVSAWAGVVRDRHQLLGDVLACLLRTAVLPVEHLPVAIPSPVQLTIEPYDNSRAKDVWATVGGVITPSFELVVTSAADSPAFDAVAPRVERVTALVAPLPPAVAAAGPTGRQG